MWFGKTNMMRWRWLPHSVDSTGGGSACSSQPAGGSRATEPKRGVARRWFFGTELNEKGRHSARAPTLRS